MRDLVYPVWLDQKHSTGLRAHEIQLAHRPAISVLYWFRHRLLIKAFFLQSQDKTLQLINTELQAATIIDLDLCAFPILDWMPGDWVTLV